MKLRHMHTHSTRPAPTRQTCKETILGTFNVFLRCVIIAMFTCMIFACSTTPVQKIATIPPSTEQVKQAEPPRASKPKSKIITKPEKLKPVAADLTKNEDIAAVTQGTPSFRAEKSATQTTIGARSQNDAQIQAATKKTTVLEKTSTTQKSSVKPVPPANLKKYTVKDGENLYTIARHSFIYAEGMLWPLIYRANRDQIKDPRQIYPGQTLNIPRDMSEPEIEEARSKAKESTVFSTIEN